MKDLAKKTFVATTAMGTSALTFANIDVAPLVTKIEGNESSMITVGNAILALVVIVVLFMMIRRVMR